MLQSVYLGKLIAYHYIINYHERSFASIRMNHDDYLPLFSLILQVLSHVRWRCLNGRTYFGGKYLDCNKFNQLNKWFLFIIFSNCTTCKATEDVLLISDQLNCRSCCHVKFKCSHQIFSWSYVAFIAQHKALRKNLSVIPGCLVTTICLLNMIIIQNLEDSQYMEYIISFMDWCKTWSTIAMVNLELWFANDTFRCEIIWSLDAWNLGKHHLQPWPVWIEYLAIWHERRAMHLRFRYIRLLLNSIRFLEKIKMVGSLQIHP